MMVRPTIKPFLLFVLAGVLARPAAAQVFQSDNGMVEFLSVSSLETFSGKSSKLTGSVDLKENIIDFFVDLSTISTGVKLRDEHLRENYLETAKFPFAEFFGKFDESNDIMLVARVATRDTQTVQVKGEFKIHGIAKQLSVPGKVFISNNQIHISADFVIKLSDFNIKVPQVMMLKVAQEQKVSIKASLKRV